MEATSEHDECIEDGCRDIEGEEEGPQTADNQRVIAAEIEPPNIYYHALRGHFVASTLRLKGNLSGKAVTMLVDSGSTHNFIQSKVVKQMKLFFEPTNNLLVTIGDGSELHSEGRSSQVPLKLGEMVFKLDLFVLPLYGADVVLGAHWLAELGTVKFNYKSLWMKFHHQGKLITL